MRGELFMLIQMIIRPVKKGGSGKYEERTNDIKYPGLLVLYPGVFFIAESQKPEDILRSFHDYTLLLLQVPLQSFLFLWGVPFHKAQA